MAVLMVLLRQFSGQGTTYSVETGSSTRVPGCAQLLAEELQVFCKHLRRHDCPNVVEVEVAGHSCKHPHRQQPWQTALFRQGCKGHPSQHQALDDKAVICGQSKQDGMR